MESNFVINGYKYSDDRISTKVVYSKDVLVKSLSNLIDDSWKDYNDKIGDEYDNDYDYGFRADFKVISKAIVDSCERTYFRTYLDNLDNEVSSVDLKELYSHLDEGEYIILKFNNDTLYIFDLTLENVLKILYCFGGAYRLDFETLEPLEKIYPNLKEKLPGVENVKHLARFSRH